MTHDNFETMYDLVYDAMVKARVAVKLDEKKEVSEGLPLTHELIHPDYVLFVDEVGNNTNMRDDGQIGGTNIWELLKNNQLNLPLLVLTLDGHYLDLPMEMENPFFAL